MPGVFFLVNQVIQVIFLADFHSKTKQRSSPFDYGMHNFIFFFLRLNDFRNKLLNCNIGMLPLFFNGNEG